MLFSRNSIAYSILVREILAGIIAPVDWFFRKEERKLLKRYGTNADYPIILILGGSRNGTTVLYQTLVHFLPVSYVSNFIGLFYQSPITAFRFFKTMIPKSNKGFQSYYGNVAGIGGPNDAFSIWNRWLGEDNNHVPEVVREQSKADMKGFFNAWLHVAKKPFLNKNNRNSLCAPLLNMALDNVFFIEIHRDPIFVAQSLVMARREIQGSDKIGWGLLTHHSVESQDPLQYIDDICKQVYNVDTALAKGREKIDPLKYIRVSYESFCQNPAKVIQEVAQLSLHLKLDSRDLINLKLSTDRNKQRLSDTEFNRVRGCINQLYGDGVTGSNLD